MNERKEAVSRWKPILTTVGILTPFSLISVTFTTLAVGVYGYYLFLALPFFIGLSAPVIYGWSGKKTYRECVGVVFLTLFFIALALLMVALEGAICILMAAPFAVLLALLGSIFGFMIQDFQNQGRAKKQHLILFILLMPVLMGMDALIEKETPLYSVTTSLIIDAPIETVWENVVDFPALDPPYEWIFKLGVAYPTHATIEGEGVGAIRECHFSTGAFVEPITLWNEPHVLQFDVTEQPVPMQELSPYDIHPPHLDHYFRSKMGEFRLRSINENRTELAGTTWYTVELWPQFYWGWWTDEIVHRIHLRVLKHIKNISEMNA